MSGDLEPWSVDLAERLRQMDEQMMRPSADLRAENAALKEQLADFQALFDLNWKADMRAIKMWQAKTGRDHVWPGRTDLTIWLLERLDAAEKEIKYYQGYIGQGIPGADTLEFGERG